MDETFTGEDLFDFAYPDDEEMSVLMPPPPISPINYGMPEPVLPIPDEPTEYEVSYRLPSSDGKRDKGIQTSAGGKDRQTTLRAVKVGKHPGAPWFKWDERTGHPGYQVIDRGQIVQCPYVRYGVYQGMPYEMGTEGEGNPQFARELFACPRLPVDAPGVDDRDLTIFSQDLPFNFAAEQALERLEDPGVLAEVGRFRMHCARIPVFSKIADDVQELARAVHKFHKSFNDQAEREVIQYEATKRRMEQARVRSRHQNALLGLARDGQLRGRFYWSGLPDMVEHPGRHYMSPLSADQAVTVHGAEEGRDHPITGVKRRRTGQTAEQKAVQRYYNVCRYCQEPGHWLHECETPHNGCKGPYCGVRRSHANYYKQLCKFPRRQVGQRGETKRGHRKKTQVSEKLWNEDAIDVDMLLDDTNCINISD